MASRGGGADDAKSGGIRQHLPGGIADGHGEIPYPHLGAAAQCQGGQALGLHIDHRHIQLGIRAHDLAGGGGTVDELHLHLAGALYHMGVGDDIALAGDDEAAAIGHGHILPQGVVIVVHIQAHHARAGALHDIRQGIGHGLQGRGYPVQFRHFPGGIGRGLRGFRLGRGLGLVLIGVLGSHSHSHSQSPKSPWISGRESMSPKLPRPLAPREISPVSKLPREKPTSRHTAPTAT